jgi:hypothetical protein
MTIDNWEQRLARAAALREIAEDEASALRVIDDFLATSKNVWGAEYCGAINRRAEILQVRLDRLEARARGLDNALGAVSLAPRCAHWVGCGCGVR